MMGLSRVFNPKYKHVLENSERRAMQPQEPLIEIIMSEIDSRGSVIDFGAGTGYYTLHLAKIFEKVYAVDLSREMLEILKERLEEKGITNVEIIQSSSLPAIKSDLIFLSNVFHELSNPVKFLKKASKLGNYILIVDWKKEKTPFGPPYEHRIGKKEVAKMMGEFFRVKSFGIYNHHYVLLGASRLGITCGEIPNLPLRKSSSNSDIKRRTSEHGI